MGLVFVGDGDLSVRFPERASRGLPITWFGGVVRIVQIWLELPEVVAIMRWTLSRA